MAKKKAGGMATKKKSAKKKATVKKPNDGYLFDGIAPPKEVCDARDDFLTAKRAAARAAEKRGEKEVALIECMKKHGIRKVKLDGENKFIELDEKEKAVVKTIPKSQRESREGNG